jgi:hypothetical protein
MPKPLTAVVIVSLLFNEAIKEARHSFTTGVTTVFSQLVHTIREKFKAEGTEGLLTRAENQPTDFNKTKFQDELQTNMDTDAVFFSTIEQLVKQLRSQDKTIDQIILSGDLKAQDISQKASGYGKVHQEMLKNLKAQSMYGNLFADLPDSLPEEIFQDLEQGSGFKLERIVSMGQATPSGKWYDQEQHEWVLLLSGSAGLRFEGEGNLQEMHPGDYANIPPYQRHRVEWTDPKEKTVWLALHYWK